MSSNSVSPSLQKIQNPCALRMCRAALGGEPARSGRPAFEFTARPLGLRAGIDPTSFNKLADELEADAFREQDARVAGHDRP